MKYKQLKEIFEQLKIKSPRANLTAHIIFHEKSFTVPYSLLSRTYCISSNNKAFYPFMSGYSIHGYCLDGTDPGVRLDLYMSEEGNEGGWIVEDCYILEHMRDAENIPTHSRCLQEDGTVCYFIGDTTIRVRETNIDGIVRLEPLEGDQLGYGQWYDLSIDKVYGYCTLLERYLNKGV